MDCNFSLFTTILFSALALLVLGWWSKAKKNGAGTKKRPPGPAGWPLFGNMFDLGTMPHQNMYKLRFIYGPVVWLRLGTVNTMVVQSAKAASELFQKHDLNFSDRKVPDVLTVMAYSEGSMAIGRYGKYWHVIRKVCSKELLNAKRMEESASLRRKCVDNMIQWIEEDAAKSRSKGGQGDVEICNFLFLVTFNVVGNLMLSKDLLEPQSDNVSFYEAMDKFMTWVGKPNVADFFPVLKRFDLLGIKRNMLRDMGKCLNIVDGFIKERIQENESGKRMGRQRDFLDTLLEYEGDGKEWSGKLTESKIKIIVLIILLDAAKSRSKGGQGDVEICNFLFLVTFNVVGNLMLSKDVLEPQSDKVNSFYDAMDKFMKWVGKPNVADFFPVLKPFDLLGIKRNMLRDMGQCLNIVDGFIKERIQENESGKRMGRQRDFLDTLLEYEGGGKEWSGKLTESKIKIIVLEMFLAGAETTGSTIEWSLTELLRNPESMRKAKEELDQVIGPSTKVEETDIDKLSYLQAVVKETLRLHPAIPLLLPRNAMEDSNYMGYHIPKETQVYVNAWAIGRDPEAWHDPLTFTPERFLNKNIEYLGQHFELIPFGAGRRICVGYPLGHRVIHLVLAALLQSFDWKLSDQVTAENLDMNERFGLSLRKLVPLKVIPMRKNIGA